LVAGGYSRSRKLQTVKWLLPRGVEPGKVDTVCETCAIAKQVKMKFPVNENEVKKTPGLV
jgi:hypothetical protein